MNERLGDGASTVVGRCPLYKPLASAPESVRRILSSSIRVGAMSLVVRFDGLVAPPSIVGWLRIASIAAAATAGQFRPMISRGGRWQALV